MHSTPRHRPQPPLPCLLHLTEEGTTTVEGGWTQVFPIPSHLETIAAVKLSPTPILIVVAPSPCIVLPQITSTLSPPPDNFSPKMDLK